MIRNTVLFSAALFAMASCASNKSFQTTQTFAPANFQVSDVYVNMVDGIENSIRIRKLMKVAGINTADVYNGTMGSVSADYPLEIEVSEINYRDPKASASSGDRTYMKYTATLREEASGEVFRTLPVVYYHVSTGTLIDQEAKHTAEKNMIRISIKNTFARLYGLEEVPLTVQTYFNTNDIFLESNEVSRKPAAKKKKPSPKVEPIAAASAPEVVVLPGESITETTKTEGGVTVIKCVVC